MAQRELREPSAQIAWMIKVFWKYYNQSGRLDFNYSKGEDLV